MNHTLDTVVNTVEQPTTVAAAQLGGNDHERWLTTIFWLVAIVLGLLQAWANRNHMDPDGISYLDMGDAYLRGDWQMAINAYWSPLYSWQLGLALLIIKPSPYWEFTVVHLVNFLIYLCALGCFAFFLREVIRYHRAQKNRLSRDKQMGLPEWAWLVLGYMLFIWSSLVWISVTKVTPEMCVAALVYLAASIILRIRRGAASWLTFISLGVVLGLSYLAKAVMFPLAFIFLGVSLFAIGDLRRAAPRVLLAFVVFLLVSSPFVIALSQAKGRLTFGDSGKLNYAWHTNGFPRFAHWQGEPVESGIPKHPTRKIFDDPAVYEFGTPIGGTYPPWYDPTYWYEGIRFHFDLRRQINIVLSGAKFYYSTLLELRGSLMIGLFILFYMSRRGWLIAKDVSEYWFLLVPGIAALGMYSLVTWLEQRYIATSIVLLLIGLFSSVRLADSRESRRLAAGITIAILAMFIVSVGHLGSRAAYATVRDFIKRDETPHVHWQVADGLKRIGVQPGDKVAYIGKGFTFFAYWPRLARVQIIADLPARNDFWAADDWVRDRIIQTFAQTGAKVIVVDEAPHWAVREGWQRIGNTDHYVYFLLQ